MIAVDTNVLVALANASDERHKRAMSDLDRMQRPKFVTLGAVITETIHVLPNTLTRLRVPAILSQLDIRPIAGTESLSYWLHSFAWFAKYAQHDPDWTDAALVTASEMDRSLRIWTYDSEFSTIWRRLDGSRIPLAVKPR